LIGFSFIVLSGGCTSVCQEDVHQSGCEHHLAFEKMVPGLVKQSQESGVGVRLYDTVGVIFYDTWEKATGRDRESYLPMLYPNIVDGSTQYINDHYKVIPAKRVQPNCFTLVDETTVPRCRFPPTLIHCLKHGGCDGFLQCWKVRVGIFETADKTWHDEFECWVPPIHFPDPKSIMERFRALFRTSPFWAQRFEHRKICGCFLKLSKD